MSRDLGGIGSEVVKPVLNPFFAVRMALPEEACAWTGVGTLTFGGRDYLGTGSLGTIGTIGEGSDGSAIGMTVSLSGIAPDLADDILTQPYRGAVFEVFVGALEADFVTLVAPPKLLWRGHVDTVSLTDGEQMALTITAESRMRDQGRPRIRRYTDQEQQRRYPGDKFFQYLASLAEINLVWGKS